MKRLIFLLLLIVALPIYAVEIVAIHTRAGNPVAPYQIILWGTLVTPNPQGLWFSWYAWNDSLQIADDTLSTMGIGGINWTMADTSRAVLDSIPAHEDLRGKYIYKGHVLETLGDTLGI